MITCGVCGASISSPWVDAHQDWHEMLGRRGTEPEPPKTFSNGVGRLYGVSRDDLRYMTLGSLLSLMAKMLDTTRGPGADELARAALAEAIARTSEGGS